MDGPPGKIRDRSGGRAGVKCRNAAAPCRQGGGAGHGASRRPRPTGIPAHGTGRPSVPPLQKCRDLSDERRRGRSQTGPRAFARGARIQDVTLIRPFGPPYPFCPSGTFPPDRGNRPSPLEGEGLRAADSRPYKGNRNLIPHPSRATARVAPTAYPAPGVLVRQSQAQNWNRTNCNFCKPRALWPGGNLDCHSDFARRKVSAWPKGYPRNGGPGVSGPMGTKCPSAASPGDPLVSFPSLGKKLAARRRRNIPLRGTKPLYHRPLIRPLRGHLPPRGKAFGGDRPLIRLACARHLPPRGKAYMREL